MIRFCIILGAAKSGTTSLFNYLAQHPEISPCHQKEPNYFGLNYNQGTDWYFPLWDKDSLETKILLEATTMYTNWPSYNNTSDNMLDFYNKHDVSMKFIYIMRNPIERIESHHTYLYINNVKQTFEQALKKKYIIHASRYAEQLDLYFDKFNNNDFLLLDFDELKRNPNELLKNICKFLDIDHCLSSEVTKKIHNKSKGRIVTEVLNR